MLAKWEECGLQELSISATELNSEALISVLSRLPHLRWLDASFLEHFTDQVSPKTTATNEQTASLSAAGHACVDRVWRCE